nr:hypothetical protein [Tanacetum cinerariifolium]
MSPCFRERFTLMLLEHQDVISEFRSLSRWKILSKETCSEVLLSGDGSREKTFKPVASPWNGHLFCTNRMVSDQRGPHCFQRELNGVSISLVAWSEIISKKRIGFSSPMAKYEKSSALTDSCMYNAFRNRDHDEHQGDDAPPKGEKGSVGKQARGFEMTTTRCSCFYGPQRNPKEPLRYLYNKDLFFLKNGNTKEKRCVLSLRKINATSFPEEDLKEKMIRRVRKVFKTFNKEARLSIQHWKNSRHNRMYKIKHRKVRNDLEEVFSNQRIIEIVKVTTEQQYGLDFIERIIVMRENDKPDRFSEADFKYLNKNHIDDIYYLCLNNKNYHENKLLSSMLTFIRICVIWERVHDFQLGIKSYRIKINLTAPTLTYLGIESCNPYFIVDKPTIGLIYLKNKEEKRIMDLVDISKFYDATLGKVLKEVKLKIFEIEFKMKALLLGKLDLKIMKAHKREIIKCLNLHKKMRIWESFVNGRPILQSMK